MGKRTIYEDYDSEPADFDNDGDVSHSRGLRTTQRRGKPAKAACAPDLTQQFGEAAHAIAVRLGIKALARGELAPQVPPAADLVALARKVERSPSEQDAAFLALAFLAVAEAKDPGLNNTILTLAIGKGLTGGILATATQCDATKLGEGARARIRHLCTRTNTKAPEWI